MVVQRTVWQASATVVKSMNSARPAGNRRAHRAEFARKLIARRERLLNHSLARSTATPGQRQGRAIERWADFESDMAALRVSFASQPGAGEAPGKDARDHATERALERVERARSRRCGSART